MRKAAPSRFRCTISLVALAAAVLLLWAAPASADYEQAKFEGQFEHFGVGGEAERLMLDATAIAINESGVGGVEPGSLYIVGTNAQVVRFGPGSEGEAPQFQEAWGWGIGSHAEGAPKSGFQRCGPALTTDESQQTYHTCEPVSIFGVAPGGEEAGHFEGLAGVAVNSATGDVYVLNETVEFSRPREHHLIEVFSATGSPIGEGFGDAAGKVPLKSIAEEPGMLHFGHSSSGGIEVDEAGVVYITDADYNGVANQQARVMSFEPQVPGDFEQYVYAGSTNDILSSSTARFTRLMLLGNGRLVTAGPETIREYDLDNRGSPICSLTVSGQLEGMTANRVTGEVFYKTFSDRKIHRLGACDEATGEFSEIQVAIRPEPLAKGGMLALALNSGLHWSSERPVGVLYAADGEGNAASHPFQGVGDIFVPAKIFPPAVLSESFANTTASSTTLKATIDPRGFAASYRFQYLSEAAYEANEPDERQSLTVRATGGVFGLHFEGRHLGGSARVDLTSGSTLVDNLVTGKGNADLHAAKGTATLAGALGKGTVIAGSKTVTAVSASEGAFAVGQTIEGKGIPSGTTISAVAVAELTLSVAATESEASASLNAGTTTVTSLATDEGVFEVGQRIEGTGIRPETTIKAVAPAQLTLSKPVAKPGTAVAITAGSTTLTAALASEGAFEVGAPIAGEGIPAGTSITEVRPGFLQISKAPTKPGSAVAISSAGPAPLAVGEAVTGPGIPAGTTITAAQGGKLTLSNPAESTVSGAQIHAGLTFDATASEVESSLEGLATIGTGGVSVSGGPGDEAGSSPYEIEFGGSLTNQDLPEIEADGSSLSGGLANATVATAHDGGGGFASDALEAPLGGGEIGGIGVGTAAVGISGLAADARYRFRVIATSHCEGDDNPPCRAEGEVTSFATYPTASTGLPNGRAYELVSPLQKNGGEVLPADPSIGSCLGGCKPPGVTNSSIFPMQSSPAGDAVTYMGYPFSPSEGAAVYNSYLSRRTSAGWQTTALSPALQATRAKGALAFDDRLGEDVIQQSSPQFSAEAPVGYENLYFQRTADPADLSVLVDSAPPNRAPGALSLEYAGHSADFSAQLFAANDALTGATPFAPAPPDPGFGGRDLYEWRAGHLTLVNVLPNNAAVAANATIASASPNAHAISTDGSRIYWGDGSHLYMREDGEFSTEIHDPGNFLTASADGSQVMLSDGCLYSLSTEACTDLTEGRGGFQGIAGTGEEGGQISRIYFVATSVLPEAGLNERGQLPQAGKDNLYSWSEGGLDFVTSLLSSDNVLGTNSRLQDWTSDPGSRTAEASPAGRYLAFVSTAPLTGHPNVGPCQELIQGGERVLVDAPCIEVFLYDAQEGQLICPSCNPTGESPLGHSTLRRILAAPDWLPQPRYLTDSGVLFFDSSDRLSVRDTNGRVEDAYEFDPQGIGGCARANGCVSLISPGSGGVDSNFLAADPSGSDVFFTTRERLVVKDTDELIDLYDAREGGGFPSETETLRPECQGESCQPVAEPPRDVTPASSVFRGAGNVHKGFAGKQHHKKKRSHHKKKHGHGKKYKRAANNDRGGAK